MGHIIKIMLGSAFSRFVLGAEYYNRLSTRTFGVFLNKVTRLLLKHRILWTFGEFILFVIICIFCILQLILCCCRLISTKILASVTGRVKLGALDDMLYSCEASEILITLVFVHPKKVKSTDFKSALVGKLSSRLSDEFLSRITSHVRALWDLESALEPEDTSKKISERLDNFFIDEKSLFYRALKESGASRWSWHPALDRAGGNCSFEVFETDETSFIVLMRMSHHISDGIGLSQLLQQCFDAHIMIGDEHLCRTATLTQIEDYLNDTRAIYGLENIANLAIALLYAPMGLRNFLSAKSPTLRDRITCAHPIVHSKMAVLDCEVLNKTRYQIAEDFGTKVSFNRFLQGCIMIAHTKWLQKLGYRQSKTSALTLIDTRLIFPQSRLCPNNNFGGCHWEYDMNEVFAKGNEQVNHFTEQMLDKYSYGLILGSAVALQLGSGAFGAAFNDLWLVNAGDADLLISSVRASESLMHLEQYDLSEISFATPLTQGIPLGVSAVTYEKKAYLTLAYRDLADTEVAMFLEEIKRTLNNCKSWPISHESEEHLCTLKEHPSCHISKDKSDGRGSFG